VNGLSFSISRSFKLGPRSLGKSMFWWWTGKCEGCGLSWPLSLTKVDKVIHKVPLPFHNYTITYHIAQNVHNLPVRYTTHVHNVHKKLFNVHNLPSLSPRYTLATWPWWTLWVCPRSLLGQKHALKRSLIFVGSSSR
jgi:hypothetical protein